MLLHDDAYRKCNTYLCSAFAIRSFLKWHMGRSATSPNCTCTCTVRFLSFRRIRPHMRRKEPSVAKGNLPAGIHRNISTIAGKSSLAAPRSRPLYARHFRQSSERASTLTGWASYSSSSFSPFWCLIERSRKPGLSKETVREKRHRNKRHNNPALLLQFDLINQGPYVYNAIQFMLCELWYI